jgi:hypothetical protein
MSQLYILVLVVIAVALPAVAIYPMPTDKGRGTIAILFGSVAITGHQVQGRRQRAGDTTGDLTSAAEFIEMQSTDVVPHERRSHLDLLSTFLRHPHRV